MFNFRDIDAKIKTCPFCGELPNIVNADSKFVECTTNDCVLYLTWILPEDWNIRADVKEN